MTDLFSKFDPLIAAARGADRHRSDAIRSAIVMEEVKSRRPSPIMQRASDTILLGTYNYMGMTFDEDVIAAGKNALDNYRRGHHRQPRSQWHLSGTQRVRGRAQGILRHVDHAMVFSTGYQANLGIISTLAGKGDYVILDMPTATPPSMTAASMGDADIVRVPPQ
jgi:8-amino-7-oxononanoate synthase